MHTTQPPLRTLTVKEIYFYLWIGEDSIRQALL